MSAQTLDEQKQGESARLDELRVLYESERTRLTVELNGVLAEREAERRRLQQQLEDAERLAEDTKSSLKSQLASAQSRASIEISRLTTTHAAEVDALRQQLSDLAHTHAMEVQDATARHQLALQQMQFRLDESAQSWAIQRGKLESSHEDEIKDLLAQLQRQKQRTADAESQSAALTLQFEQEMASAGKRYDAEVTRCPELSFP